MANRADILEWIHSTLNVDEFDDYCVNGLQVQGTPEIKTIVCGVSVSQRLFELAIKKRADMILVHHGMFWKSDKHPMKITGILYKRLAMLIKSDINLAGYHLPLDAHPVLGNNAQIVQRLGLKIQEPVDVGFIATAAPPILFNNLIQKVNNILETESIVFPFGPAKTSKILIISGGSSSAYPLALKHGADTFLAGSIKESQVREFEEHGLNFINAGHYNTEKFGIQSLCAEIQKQFGIVCEFIDIPNPI
ncbi:Nif3-like dinuclear metal center hexameric protein [candidate division KSB1 bacterium]|nr:Nif3-like dinuclear metal center hexameric protein [candidate division KSB1 bacterium]